MSKIICFMLCAALIPVVSFADGEAPSAPTEERPTDTSLVGIMAGDGLVGNGGGNRFVTGSRVCLGLHRDRTGILSLGADTSTIWEIGSVGGSGIRSMNVSVLIELLDREAWGTGIYFGGRIGFSISAVTLTTQAFTVSGIGSSLAVAPVVGYEFPLSKHVALDLDASYLSLTGGAVQFKGSDPVTYNPPSSFQFLAGVNFRW